MSTGKRRVRGKTPLHRVIGVSLRGRPGDLEDRLRVAGRFGKPREQIE